MGVITNTSVSLTLPGAGGTNFLPTIESTGEDGTHAPGLVCLLSALEVFTTLHSMLYLIPSAFHTPNHQIHRQNLEQVPQAGR